jgi:hypothetical protein
LTVSLDVYLETVASAKPIMLADELSLSPKDPADIEGRELLFDGVPVGATYQTSVAIDNTVSASRSEV